MKTALVFVLAAMVISAVFTLGHLPISEAGTPPREAIESKPSHSSIEQEVTAAERAGLEALKSGNLQLFGDATADDAIFVDAHGSASKEQVLKNVAEFKLTEFSMDDVKFLPLTKNPV